MVKKDGMILVPLFFHHVPEEQSITDDISSPHTLWFFDQAIEPFQTIVQPPDWCTLHGTSKEVEDSTDGTYVTTDVQLIPMRVRPLFLLRSRHANPEQIRVGSIDGINDSLVVLIRELRLIRRRISHHLQVRIIHGSTLHNQDALAYLGIAILISHNQGTKAAQIHPAFLNPHLPQAVPARTRWRRPLMVRQP